jgi:hypothetical protein
LFCLFFEETGVGLLFFCVLAVIFLVLLIKKLFMGVYVRISKCCLLLRFLKYVCGAIEDNGDIVSVASGREDTVAGE